MNLSSRRLLSCLLLSAGLAACGGGDGGSGQGDDGGVVLPRGGETITVTRAECNPFGNAPRPRNDLLNELQTGLTLCPGGRRLDDWKDGNGSTRRACLYDNGAASETRKLPLVVFLQGSAIPTDLQLPVTNLLPALGSADLTGDPARPGFILLQPVGRITDHFYPLPNSSNTIGWDVWYRQMIDVAGGREVNGERHAINADAATIDHYIAEQVATGRVDTSRIYLVGWSNGAALALLYGQNRPEVAAVFMYSGPDPYDSLNDPCGQRPVRGRVRNDTELQVFNPGIPVLHLQNNCDIYASCPNGLALRDKLQSGGTADIRHQVLTGLPLQSATDSCRASCGADPRGDGSLLQLEAMTVGIANHLAWPFGWREDIFAFLREHPRVK